MEIVLVIFGPMVLAFVILALLPAGRPYAIGLVVVLAICAAIALQPLPPSNGPDDWYRGIGNMGGMLGLAAALATAPAQAARHFKKLAWPAYLGLLALTVFVGLGILSTIGF